MNNYELWELLQRVPQLAHPYRLRLESSPARLVAVYIQTLRGPRAHREVDHEHLAGLVDFDHECAVLTDSSALDELAAMLRAHDIQIDRRSAP